MRRYDFMMDGDAYALVRSEPAPTGFEAVPPAEASQRLARWMRRDAAVSAAALLESLDREPMPGTTRDGPSLVAAVVRELGCDLSTTRLYRRAAPRVEVTQFDEGVTNLSDLSQASDPLASSPADHWIEIQVTDEGGRALVGTPYRMELPDGKVREGRTDDFGRVREDGIFAPGNCRLYFPALEEKMKAAG